MQTADPKKVEIKIKKFTRTEKLMHILMLWPTEESKALFAFGRRIAKELPQARTIEPFPPVTIWLPNGHAFRVYRVSQPTRFIVLRIVDCTHC